MITSQEILNALQFDFSLLDAPINTTSDPAYHFEYQFAGASQPDDLWRSYEGWTPLSAAEKAAVRAGMDHIETFLNVEFTEVVGADDPDMNIGKVTIPGSTVGYGGYSYSAFSTGVLADYDNFAVYDNTLDISEPQWMSLILHELGHALGLKHPFEGADALPTALDNNKFTIMSYTENPDTGVDADAMMLYDIFALQDQWGATTSHNHGNTTYDGPRTNTVDAIWDTGGRDSLDARAVATDVILNLNAGEFSRFGNYDDVVIAFGVQIEDAFGGGGNDQLHGNAFGNTLNGGAGDDRFWGNNGNDVIIGGAGDDTLNGNAGMDTMNGGPGSDTFYVDHTGDRVIESRTWAGTDRVNSTVDFWLKGTHVEELVLRGADDIRGIGNGLMNRITGNDGDNILDGGKNNDTLIGGLGNDTYLIRAPGDTAVEQAGEGNDAVKAYRSYALEAHVEKLYMQNIFTKDGNPANLNGIGNGLDNTIIGTPYANTIVGREGNDTLKGQGGADTFVFDRALDEATNVDRLIDFGNGDDVFKLKASVFTGLSAGALAADAFVLGTAVADATDRIIYDQTTGQLWHDADGVGGADATLFATLANKATLEADDFSIF